MGLIELNSLNRKLENGGELLEVELNGTRIIIEITRTHRDIRIVDGETVVKIRLNQDFSIQDVLKDDRFLSAN